MFGAYVHFNVTMQH